MARGEKVDASAAFWMMQAVESHTNLQALMNNLRHQFSYVPSCGFTISEVKRQARHLVRQMEMVESCLRQEKKEPETPPLQVVER